MTGARQAGAYRAQARRSGATSPYPDPFGLLPTLAWTVAGQAYQHYGYQDWIAKQAVPWTASGTVSVTIQATTPGSNGNADAETTFYIATPIACVGSQGSASGPITGGADQETQDVFCTACCKSGPRRRRVVTRPTMSSGPSRCRGLRGPGRYRTAWAPALAIVHFMMDVSEAAHGGFPQGTNGVAGAETRDTSAIGDQLAVADAIYPKRPATALVYACAPASQAVNYMY